MSSGGAAFPPVLVESPGPMELPPLEVEGAARIHEVFVPADLEGLPPGDVLRIHTAGMLPELEAAGFQATRLILSPLVDPVGLSGEVLERSLVEVAGRADVLRARDLPCAGLLGRGQEAGGVCREAGGVVVFQLLRKLAPERPFWMTGFVGPELARAYRAEGAAGVVLPADLFSRRESPGPRQRFHLPGGAMVRLFLEMSPEAVAELEAEAAADPMAFLRRTYREELWRESVPSALEDAARRFTALWEMTPPGPPCGNLFGEDTPYTRRWKTRYSLVQGPMSRVAVSPDFAERVHRAGAFPYLALAGLSLEEIDSMLAECGRRGFPHGVGIVAIGTSAEDFDALVKVLERHRPDRVLIAAPQLDQIERLRASGLELFVHAPVLPVFRSLRELGVKNFVLEGESAGGHVSTVGSLTLWQDVLEELAHSGGAEEVTLTFAGGLYDHVSAGLVSSLIHFHGLAGRLAAALQLGTAYLTTEEVVEHAPPSERFRQVVVEGEETLVTGETLRLRVRQVATPSVRELLEREREIYAGDQPHEEKKRAIEEGYLGTLSQAVTAPAGASGGSFMAGAACAVVERVKSLEELHADLVRDREARTAPAVSAPVAVVGIGAILPGCPTATEYFRNILRKRCFVRDVPPERWERDVFLSEERGTALTSYSGIAGLVGEVDFDSREFRIPPNVARRMDRSQKLALLCARAALEDAGYLDGGFDRERVAVILGNSMGGDAADESAQAVHTRRMRARLEALAAEHGLAEEVGDLLDEYEERFPDVEIDEDTLPGELSNVISGRVAWAFDLHGENYTVDAACASSLAAVAQAVEALRSRRCDLALTGGVDTQTDVGTFVKFSKLTALSARGSFPFDYRGDGFVMGEGCGVLALKRYADALRDGDRVYGLIAGWGSSSDGAGQGITAPRSSMQVLAMRRAYEDAGVDPRDLDYVECHGTGTRLGDETEWRSLTDLGAGGDRGLPIGSAKAMVGHLKAGAGVAGLLRGLLAVHARVVPPQVNFSAPKADIPWAEGNLRVADRVEPLGEGTLRAGVSSFGFGGTNFHLVLRSADAGARPPVVDVARYRHPHLGELDGDLALLFPGQGSQYVGMLAELREDPVARALWERADRAFEELRGEPLSPLVYPETRDPDAEAALTDTAVAQPAIFVVSAVLLEKLRELGVRPAAAIGHSLGEYSALYAAGVLDFEDALRAVSLRGLSMRERGGEDAGSMAFVAADPETAAGLCEEVPGYVVVANLNAYEQTVVSGESEAVERFVARAEEEGLRARRLNVSAAFHSRLVAESAADVGRALAEMPLRSSRLPVPANLTGHVYPRAGAGGEPELLEGEERSRAIDLLTRQIEAPVDFVGQIELAYEAGVRRFLEVGPKNVLARLVREILQGKEFQALHLDHPREDAGELLAGIAGRLEEAPAIERLPVAAAPAVRRSRTSVLPRIDGDLSTEETIRRVVSQISGYPPEEIGEDDDFERDLGIDTLKIFEIFSRLRSTVLPAEVQNFRELTSLGKILGAIESARERDRAPAGRGSGVRTLVLEEREVEAAPPPAGPRPWRVETAPGTEGLEERLPALAGVSDAHAADGLVLLELPADMDALITETLPWLRERLVELGRSSRDVALRVVSLAGPAGFSRAAFRCLSSLVRAAQKDLPDLDLGYLHVEGRPGEAELAGLLAQRSPARRRDGEGRQLEERLVPPDQPAPPPLEELLTERDLVLVTGGARGIAAALVQDLLDRTRARFLLLGRRPEVEEWIVAAGADRVEYLACDVTDPGAVRAAGLAGRGVTLVIHAAGVEVSRNLKDKPAEEFERVVAVKLRGAANVLGALEGEALRAVVHFSSVAALFGNHGQVDYAAANGYLNGYPSPGAPVLSVAWAPWAEVGMATRGAVQEILEASGVEFLTVPEGRRRFRELLAGRLAGGGAGTRCVGVFGALGPGFVLSRDALLDEASTASAAALLGVEGRQEIRYTFDLGSSPYLADHRINEAYYLPAVSLLRQFLKRAAKAGPVSSADFRDLRLLSPVVFEPGEEQLFAVHASGGEYLVEVSRGDSAAPVISVGFEVNHLGEGDRDETSALRDRILAHAERPYLPYDAAPAAVPRDEIYKTYFHGEAFQVLDELDVYTGDLMTARVRMDPAALAENPLGEFGKVPYLLEAVFHTAGLATTINIDSPVFYIPSGVGRCRVFMDACERAGRATVAVEVLEEGERKRFHAVVLGEDDEVLMAVEDLVMSRSVEEVPHKKSILVPSSPLRLGGCEVLVLDLTEAAAFTEPRFEELYTPLEREEIERVSSAKRRREKLAGKLAVKVLAREVMKREAHREYGLGMFEVLADDAPVQVAFLGAPHLDTLLAGYHFSISHSGERAAAAAARGPCAVDIERVRKIQDGTIQRICTAAELRQVDSELGRFAGDPRLRGLYEQALPLVFFTQKEAILKAVGLGIQGGIGKVSIERLALSTPLQGSYDGEPYRLLTVFDERYVLSVARRDEDGRRSRVA